MVFLNNKNKDMQDAKNKNGRPYRDFNLVSNESLLKAA
jgi:hypothetical protein